MGAKLHFAMRFGLISFALLVAVSAAAGQSSIHSADCTKRTVPVTVVDDTGKVVASLNKSSFQVDPTHFGLHVASVALTKRPLRSILLLDDSASMLDPKELPVLRSLAHGIIEAAESDPLALATFTEKIDQHYDFGTAREELSQAVDGLSDKSKPGHRGTGLYDSLTSVDQVLSQAEEVDAIFLVSDGGENRSKASLPEARKKLLGRGVRLFFLEVTNNRKYPTAEEMEGPLDVRDLATVTGGKTLEVPASSGVSEEAKNADGAAKYAYLLAGFSYQVEIEAAQPIDKPVKLKLSTALPGGSTKSWTLLYPHELPACSAKDQSPKTKD